VCKKTKELKMYKIKYNNEYIGGVTPLIKWLMFNYKGHFINTYHTPHKNGFDKYIDKDQFINLKNNLNMNQKELSNFLGVSQRSISRIINGEPIGKAIINKLKKTFGESKYTFNN